ncbi:hypothetical protein SAMN05519105_1512 [Rhodobacter sp. 24-YEA-8]|nr:hypothetical protein SAMN05519105_1512 [Rhodobacter sp. 24-YEA-8]
MIRRGSGETGKNEVSPRGVALAKQTPRFLPNSREIAIIPAHSPTTSISSSSIHALQFRSLRRSRAQIPKYGGRLPAVPGRHARARLPKNHGVGMARHRPDAGRGSKSACRGRALIALETLPVPPGRDPEKRIPGRRASTAAISPNELAVLTRAGRTHPPKAGRDRTPLRHHNRPGGLSDLHHREPGPSDPAPATHPTHAIRRRKTRGKGQHCLLGQ